MQLVDQVRLCLGNMILYILNAWYIMFVTNGDDYLTDM